MKKNITINMQGRLYPIDEDAYDLLKQYEDSLRGHFAGQDGGQEIVDDIEERIAELFDETIAGKAAIDIGDVERIITRIGNPQQMDEGAESAPGGDGTAAPGGSGGTNDGGAAREAAGDESFWSRAKQLFVRKDRSLYRDPSDKKLFGVIAGLAHYYDGDPTWWRLVVVLVFLFFFFLPGDSHGVAFYMVLVYIILGIIMPQAATPEDRLRMNGRDVTPQNLAEEVTADSRAQQQARTPQRRGCLPMLADGLLFLIKAALWVVGATFVALLVILLVSLLIMLFMPTFDFFQARGILFSWAEHPVVGTIAVASMVLFVVLLAFWLGRALFGSRKQQLSTRQRLAFVALLIAALTGSMACGTVIVSELLRQVSAHDRLMADRALRQHIHNGIFMPDSDWYYLQAGGWKVLSDERCNDRYTAIGEYYTGDTGRRYLDCFDENGMQVYRAERTDSTLQPGTYRLTAVVRSDGPGAYIYAIADGKTYKAEIPAEGNTGGPIWQEAVAESGSDDDGEAVGSSRIQRQIAEANDGNGYGWSRISIDSIVTRTGRVSYGLTTDATITEDQFGGTWFSATDFNLKKQQGKVPAPPRHKK